MTTMSTEQLQAELARLQAENAKLKEKKVKPLTIKVSEKKAVSVYGINARFPVTLYAEGMLRFLDHSEDIRAFIKEHKDELSWKNEE